MFWNYLVFKPGCHQDRRKSQGGFGLVELMVSITVMVIVSSIILVRQSSFNSAVLLRGQAYEVALQAREIQLNAVSASNDSGGFRSVIGMHLDSSTANNDQYRVFRDSSTTGTKNSYDSGEEFGKQGKIDPRFEISTIRAGGTPYGEVSIVFERPNFDAHFYDTTGNEISVSTVKIDIAQRGSTGTTCGDVRTVEITRSGQIAVQDCP